MNIVFFFLRNLTFTFTIPLPVYLRVHNLTFYNLAQHSKALPQHIGSFRTLQDFGGPQKL